MSNALSHRIPLSVGGQRSLSPLPWSPIFAFGVLESLIGKQHPRGRGKSCHLIPFIYQNYPHLPHDLANRSPVNSEVRLRQRWSRLSSWMGATGRSPLVLVAVFSWRPGGTKHNWHSSFVPRPATACWDTMKQALVPGATSFRSLLQLGFGSFEPYKCLCLQMGDFPAKTKLDGIWQYNII